MKNIRVARRYASALVISAEEGGVVEAVSRDLDRVGKVIEASREFRLLLASPVVSPEKKAAVVEELFGRRVGRETMTFIKLLLQKGREEFLSDVIEQFRALLDEMRGIVAVEVTSALELTRDQERRLRKQLEQYTGKHVRIHPRLDTSIRGGVVMRIGDTVIDGSITHQLVLLRERMAEGGLVEHEV
ncbi:MAG: ATP synthase F1 subunit delta [Bacteroidota bacterium]